MVFKHNRVLLFLTALLVITLMAPPVLAASKSRHHHASANTEKNTDKAIKTSAKKISKRSTKRRGRASAAPAGNRFSALVVDASTGNVLYERNAASIRYPASLTKMMTLYLTFEALKDGKLDVDAKIPVSMKASRQPQTNIALQKGDAIPVRSAVESVVVRSANDSAMVLAEAIGGTEWNFALMMTKKARELGMDDTVFRNPNGLPDNKQHTTAFDLAKLAIALRRDFPEYYPVFKLQSFEYNGVEYPGHNRVIERYNGADGIKTGYIRASGFNLVTSVKKDGYNIVGVILGGPTAETRDNMMIDMLDRTFVQLENGDKSLADNDNFSKKNSLLNLNPPSSSTIVVQTDQGS